MRISTASCWHSAVDVRPEDLEMLSLSAQRLGNTAQRLGPADSGLLHLSVLLLLLHCAREDLQPENGAL